MKRKETTKSVAGLVTQQKAINRMMKNTLGTLSNVVGGGLINILHSPSMCPLKCARACLCAISIILI